jgi:glycerophosphoryl diester phosphodiesterase
VKKGILNIAHRGFSSRYPECTALAYQKAVEAGADFIEVDIMRTRDGQFVAFHASDLAEVSEARGKIAEHTLEELGKVNITAGFGSRFGFQPIPTLDEVLELAGRAAVHVCAEMKDLEEEDIPGYEDLIVPFFDRHNLIGRSVFNTKSFAFLEACHRKYPVIPTAADLEKGSEGLEDLDGFVEKTLKAGARIVQYDYHLMKPEVTKELLAHGLSVWAWPVNDEEAMGRVVEWGVSAILTDDPQRLKRFLEK